MSSAYAEGNKGQVELALIRSSTSTLSLSSHSARRAVLPLLEPIDMILYSRLVCLPLSSSVKRALCLRCLLDGVRSSSPVGSRRAPNPLDVDGSTPNAQPAHENARVTIWDSTVDHAMMVR